MSVRTIKLPVKKHLPVNVSLDDTNFRLFSERVENLYHSPRLLNDLKCYPIEKSVETQGFRLFNTSRAIIPWFLNAYRGNYVGYYIEFVLNSVSFRVDPVESADKMLILDLGFSHTVVLKLPSHAFLAFDKRKFKLASYDFGWLSDFSRLLQLLRYPDSYRGKGILFKNQVMKLKPGKQRQ